MLITLLIILLLLSLLGGMGWSNYGPMAASPAGILIVIILVWLLTGHRL